MRRARTSDVTTTTVAVLGILRDRPFKEVHPVEWTSKGEARSSAWQPAEHDQCRLRSLTAVSERARLGRRRSMLRAPGSPKSVCIPDSSILRTNVSSSCQSSLWCQSSCHSYFTTLRG